MRHQVPDGDVAFPVALEAGNEGRHAVAQPDLPFLDQHHHARRRRHDLRERRQIEDRIERHRLGGGNKRAAADRLLVKRPVAAADQDDCARQFLLGDRLRDQRLDAVELFRASTWEAACRWRHRGRRRAGAAANCFMEGIMIRVPGFEFGVPSSGFGVRVRSSGSGFGFGGSGVRSSGSTFEGA